MKALIVKYFQIIILILFHYTISADSNHKIKVDNDTILLNDFCYLALKYAETNRDSSVYYSEIALEIAKKLNQKFYQASILSDLGYTLLSNGDYGNALTKLLIANSQIDDRNIARNVIITPFFNQYFTSKDPKTNRIILLGYIKNSLAMLYGRTENFDKQLTVLKEAKKIIESETNDLNLKYTINNNIANAYLNMERLDSALFFQKIVLKIERKIENKNYNGASNKAIGDIYFRLGKFNDAKENYIIGLQYLNKGQNTFYKALTKFALADTYRKLGMSDSSLYYSKLGITNYRSLGSYVPELEEAYTALALSFKDESRYDSAFHYMYLSKRLSDSIYGKEIKTLTTFQNIGFNEQMRLKEAEAERIKIKNRLQIFTLLGGLLLFSVIAIILYKSNTQKVRANILLAERKKELENTLLELKSTQSQLIQSEKMASLGELTAGIAHEIQNPLNFVNNFSEVSNELISELKVESLKVESERDKGFEDELLNDIAQNLEKINHHGKRASSIVKSMIEHSRTSSGKKEPADINALADEYLKLAYQSLRAKYKDFNATLETNFDTTLPKINVVSQDIGRVILNLITNAFYAVNERSKKAESDYVPTVSINTLRVDSPLGVGLPASKQAGGERGKGDYIQISVSDNGSGIPDTIKEKIFQPFFTTKPTGQGTGLGLSLAYDIVKAHGGMLEMESAEGVGTKFVIQLPYKTNG